jgi:stage IV sporulation protein FB
MKWRGVPVVLDWSVLIGLPWFLFRHKNLTDMAIAFVAFLFLLFAHELGHAAVAKWRKVRVFEIRLLFMHGICRHEVPDHEADDVWIPWGGVAAQFAVLVIAFGTGELLWIYAPVAYLNLQPLLRILIETNLFIILLNLLPIPPFDGAKAWRVLPLFWARLRGRERLAALSPKRWIRNRRLKQQSKDVAADIIERLKKRP